MTTRTPTPKKPVAEAADSATGAPSDVQDSDTPAVDYEARYKELEAELARLRAAAEPAPAKERPPTHVQYLANGESVETNAPVATHHSFDDGTVVPVVATYPIAPGEGE